MNNFEKRIDLNFPLKEISEIVCKKYNLGKFVSNRLIKIGYEDFNYILNTGGGKFVVKIFSNLRTDEECEVLVEKAHVPYLQGVSTPKIYDADGEFLFKFEKNKKKFRLCVTDHIDGKDFYRIGEPLSLDELKFVAVQTAMLNNINFQPPFVYDKWAIVNFEKEYNENISLVEKKYAKKIGEIFEKFKMVDMSKLKKGFVHGDIISTNIMRDKHGKLFIIDFSVGNFLPRIVDLAVCICDLCLDYQNLKLSKERTDAFVSAYESVSKLSEYERECLNVFIACHQAMTIIETTREKVIEKNETDENEWFMQDSKTGLDMTIKNKFV
jgi:homoserine kinase type II